MSRSLRLLFGFLALLTAALSSAQFTLNVTSPTEGAFIGLNNNLRFIINGADAETTVRLTITGPAGSTQIERKFNPNASGEIDGTIPFNFNLSSPQGAYTLDVVAFDPTFTHPTITRNVTLDVTKPKLLEFNPNFNAFVKGPIVPINVKVNEANVKEWRIQINGQDIPNNTGTSLDGNSSFSVNWDVTNIESDGQQTINISVTDLADNVTTQNVTVTVDRLSPVISIVYPRSDTSIRPGSSFGVIIQVTDQTGNSMDSTGVDVTLETTGGAFIMRVPRSSFRNIGGNLFRWVGTVNGKRRNLPNQFVLKVTALDRAGNAAVTQTVTIKLK